MKKIDWIICLLIVVLSVFTLRDLFKPGFYTSHDGVHQIVRLYYFDQALHDGQFPPRWAGDLLNGFGYPLFIFSYHMPWWIAEPIHLAGLSIIDSVKMTFLLGFILSGISMYVYQKELLGRIAALGGTAVYLYAPNRFLNIFVRAAIGDATAYIFPPIIFLTLYKLRQHNRIHWGWASVGALAYAGLLLSHAMVFILVSFSVFLYAVYWLVFSRYKKQLFLGSVFVFVLGIGLASYYFIPSVVERNTTIFNKVMGNAFTGMTFVDFRRLLYSPWGYGAMFADAGAMSLQLGLAQWGIGALAILTLSGYAFMRKRVHGQKQLLLDAFFFFSLFTLTIISMLSISLPFWKMMNSVIVIDFTWRVMPVAIFSCSLLAGYVLRLLPLRIPLTVAVIVFAMYANRNHIHINQSVDWDVPFYLSLEKTTNSFDEYTPLGVNDVLVSKKRDKVQVSDHSAVVRIDKNSSNQTTFHIDSPTQSSVQLNTLYYEGWNIDVNKSPVHVRNESGVMAFDIPKGESKVIATFTETPLRKMSDIVTLLSGCIIIFALVQYKKYE